MVTPNLIRSGSEQTNAFLNARAFASVEEYRKAAIDAVQKLSIDVGIPTKLEALKEEDLDFLAESAHADACAPGNPKDASVEDLKNLFRKLM